MGKEDELLKVYGRAKRGSKDNYEYLCTLLFDEVYKMVALVYDKEENRKKLVNHIFAKMKTRLNEFNPEIDDIHRWVCVFSVQTIYFVYSAQKGDIFSYKEANSGYAVSYVEDDDKLADCAARYNEEISEGYLDKDSSAFGMLSKGQIILYELFCYAGCTVEEIEDLLEVDSIYILSELADMKAVLYTGLYEEGWETEPVGGNQASDRDRPDALAEASDRDKPAALAEASDAEKSAVRKKAPAADMLITNAPPRRETEHYQGEEEDDDAIAGLFRRIPDKVIKLAALGTVALILVIILSVVLIGGRGNKNKGVNNNNPTVQGGNHKESSSPTKGTEKQTDNTGGSVISTEGTNTTAPPPTTGIRPTSPTQAQTPAQTQAQTPAQTQAQTPAQTPEQTPEETPEQTPEETPEQTPEETPEQTPEETPEQTPEETPEQTPEETPEQTPEETPEQTPEETPEQAPEETPQAAQE